MNEQTVCEVPDVRGNNKCEHSEGSIPGLYLPVVYERNKKRERAERVKRITSKICKLAASIFVGSIAGFITASWAVPAAYEYRGYKAIGGEWILIVGAVTIAIYYSGKLLNRRDRL